MYMKKMPFPGKKKAPSEKEMALELEVESEEEPEMEGEAPEELDLKSMMREGEEAPEMGPLAEVSDEDLMAEMKKRGLMPEGEAAPEAAMPKMK